MQTHNDPVRSSRTQTPSNRFKPLRNIDDKTALNIWRVDPITRFIQDLQPANRVLREEREETDGIFVGSYTLGAWCRLGVFDKFHAGHVADEGVEGCWGEGERFSDGADEVAGEEFHGGCVAVYECF